MNLVLLPQAAQDIADAVTYLNRANGHAVAPFRQAIAKSLRLIATNSRVGHHSRTDGVREWSVPDWPYLIPYRVVGEEVQVLRVWHTKRRQPRNWH